MVGEVADTEHLLNRYRFSGGIRDLLREVLGRCRLCVQQHVERRRGTIIELENEGCSVFAGRESGIGVSSDDPERCLDLLTVRVDTTSPPLRS